MLFKISELVSLSPFLQYWDGKKNFNIKMQDSKLAFYRKTGKDFEINITTIKILQKYDIKTFNRILNIGFCIKFQTINIIVYRKNELINCFCKSDSGNDWGSLTINKKGHFNVLSNYYNSDIEYLILYLFLDVNFNKLDSENGNSSEECCINEFNYESTIFKPKYQLTNIRKSKSTKFSNIDLENYEELINSLEVI